MAGDMTVDKLLMQDSVKGVLGKLNEQKDTMECIVAIFVDGDNNLQCLASMMSMAQLLGWLEMAKFQTSEQWSAESDDAV